MLYQDEKSLKLLISRYQRRVFALILYLIGGDRDKAYEVAASSFAEAINRSSSLEKEDVFFNAVVSIAIENSRSIKSVPTLEQIDVMDFSAAEKKSLSIIQTALQTLSLDAKALLLLRDQLHLPRKDISTMMSISENNARVQIEQARSSLRRKIEEILNREG
jgi:DNA-directed RNA polymerase specialized sigma24 family protein